MPSRFRLHLLLLLVFAAGGFGHVSVARAIDPAVMRQIEDQIREQIRQRQEYERQLVQAVQQRNQQLVKQYQEQAKKQAEAYREQLKKMQEAGMTPTDIRNMQREAVLAQLPRSQRSALQRKWTREDRLRQRVIDRAKRTGEVVPADEGELDLGNLEGLQVE